MLVSQEISRMYKMDDPIQEFTDQIPVSLFLTLNLLNKSQGTWPYVFYFLVLLGVCLLGNQSLVTFLLLQKKLSLLATKFGFVMLHRL